MELYSGLSHQTAIDIFLKIMVLQLYLYLYHPKCNIGSVIYFWAKKTYLNCTISAKSRWMRTHPIISDFHNLPTTVVSDVTHITNILKSTVSVRLSSSHQHCQAFIPTTCTWIARFQVSALVSINSKLNSPLALSSATVTGEIDREALPGVELKLNRSWNLARAGPAEPSAWKLTIPSPLNLMTPKAKPKDRL